ncbi:MAG: VanZ family protein [Brachybacterium sp.]|nr:VanZ family protein [Brachybacterium sp.]
MTAAHSRLRTARILAVALLLLYVPAAALLVLGPDGWTVNRLNVAVWITVLGPFDLHRFVSPELFAGAMNVLLFVPATAAAVVLRPSWWWILVGAGLGGMIEMYQLMLGSRQASVLDVLANTAGAALGAALGMGALALLTRGKGSNVGA